jgi:hypothetical protein
MPGKRTDTRAAGFIKRHGRLAQVELDALPPDVLRGLYAGALGEHMDMSVFEAQLRREKRDRKTLS